MQHHITNDGEEMQVRIEPRLNFEDHDAFRGVLNTIAQSKCKRCVFDLSRLEAVDSAGLGMIMIAYQHSQKEKWSMVLDRPHGQVKRLLEITDIGKIIQIRD